MTKNSMMQSSNWLRYFFNFKPFVPFAIFSFDNESVAGFGTGNLKVISVLA